ncbi:TetR/AcrR family transcriptional regulator [Streptomyces microflavus]|uniref:TetR/AcrR family transcriptional regulator n=1 Tax=Streptomyces microflavus TaxID=1919 RepID=UPI0037F695AC
MAAPTGKRAGMAGAEGTTGQGRGGMSAERRRRVRLEVSREASRLFWTQGVEATSGDQIAAAVGLSTRTIWRHFRSKESCAEPIVMSSVDWELDTLRNWPLGLSLEDHFRAEALRHGREATPTEREDIALGIKMIRLGDSEPAIRTAWLMACDQVERQMAEIIAKRLGGEPDDVEIRLHAAAAGAALRVLNEHVGAGLLDGASPEDFLGTPERIAHAVRRATGGAVGDPVTGGTG